MPSLLSRDLLKNGADKTDYVVRMNLFLNLGQITNF